MAHGASYTVKYRRRREAKTNYRRRLNLLKAGKPRLVVRKTNAHTIIQVVEYTSDGDRIIASAHSKQLKKFGWAHATGSIPAAYLTGLLCGKNATDKKIPQLLVDLGMDSLVKGGRLYAAVKGAMDAGVEIPTDETIFPSEERLMGQHIAGHVEKSKDIAKDVESLKNKILEGK